MEPASLHLLCPYDAIVRCLDLKRSILRIFGCNCKFENKSATLEKKSSHCELIYTKKQAINLILERIMKKGELRCTLKLIV